LSLDILVSRHHILREGNFMAAPYPSKSLSPDM
jgi:hypothetical protein